MTATITPRKSATLGELVGALVMDMHDAAIRDCAATRMLAEAFEVPVAYVVGLCAAEYVAVCEAFAE